MRPTTALIAVLLVLGLAACGGDDDDSGAAAETTTEAEAAAEPTKPEVEVPGGDPPNELEIADITEGEGPEAAPGDVVTVQYVGVLYSDGSEFDASWDRGEPFTFQLGGGQVIPGWDEGVAGMRVGGRRELVIPPDQAYGRQGAGPIGPNETLVFVVDLLDVAS